MSCGRTLIEKKRDTRERKEGSRKEKARARRSLERYGRRFIAGNLPWLFFSPAVRTRLPSDIFSKFFAERFPVSITNHKVLLNFHLFRFSFLARRVCRQDKRDRHFSAFVQYLLIELGESRLLRPRYFFVYGELLRITKQRKLI